MKRRRDTKAAPSTACPPTICEKPPCQRSVLHVGETLSSFFRRWIADIARRPGLVACAPVPPLSRVVADVAAACRVPCPPFAAGASRRAPARWAGGACRGSCFGQRGAFPSSPAPSFRHSARNQQRKAVFHDPHQGTTYRLRSGSNDSACRRKRGRARRRSPPRKGRKLRRRTDARPAWARDSGRPNARCRAAERRPTVRLAYPCCPSGMAAPTRGWGS